MAEAGEADEFGDVSFSLTWGNTTHGAVPGLVGIDVSSDLGAGRSDADRQLVGERDIDVAVHNARRLVGLLKVTRTSDWRSAYCGQQSKV